jgi:dipeptidyl aminopeptidase/acylaminoacyl peptidase
MVIGLAAVCAGAIALPGPAHAAFPGSNGLIAFDSRRTTAYFQIYTMADDGSAQTRILAESANDTQPIWSPSGKKIAYVSDASGAQQIWTMGANGSNPTQLTSAGVNTSPTWSPDGSRIAFVSSRSGNNEIWAMRANGSSQVQVTHDLVDDEDPSWSVTNVLAYAGNATGAYNVYTISPKGMGETQLTNSTYSARYPDWSPDGTQIAFTEVDPATGNSHPQVWAMAANGSGQLALTNDPYDNYVSAWSPDGTKIAFISLRGSPANRDIFVMDANGTNEADLTNNAAGDFYPSWQPIVNPQPDVAVRFSSSSTWTGSGVFSSDGTGETLIRRAAAGKATTFVVRITNAGDVPDTITVQGCATTAKMSATYSAGGKNITVAMASGRYRIASLAIGASKSISVTLSLRGHPTPGSTQTCLVMATSRLVRTKLDTVGIALRAR